MKSTYDAIEVMNELESRGITYTVTYIAGKYYGQLGDNIMWIVSVESNSKAEFWDNMLRESRNIKGGTK